MRIAGLFLHTAWRSAGTWIWQQFRARDNVMGFCEPLNEWLADAKPSTLLEPRPEIWPSGHSDIGPYFAEYAPLLTPRGVAGYDRRFAYESYFMPVSQGVSGLERYVQSLCDLAHANGRLPVLKFTRSLGRVEWMRTHFPDAAHVVIVRSPLAQYRSAAHLYTRGHRDFLASPIALLAHFEEHPVVRDVLCGLQCNVRAVRRRTLERTRVAAEQYVARGNPQETYRTSLAFWLATALTSMPFADLVIDAECLAENAEYRRLIEERLAELSGIDISLASASAPSSGDVGGLMPPNDVLRTLHESGRSISERFAAHSDVNAELLAKLA